LKNKFLFILFLLGLFIQISSCSSPDEPEVQSETRGFNQEKIDSYNQQEKYDYYKEVERSSNPVLEIFLNIFSFIFKILASPFGLAILIVLIIIVIIAIVKRGKSGLLEPIKERDSVVLLSKEDLETTDYKKLLEMAIQANDMRLATRFTFLITLQYLQKNKKIKWHLEKTNHEYLNELSPELQKPFSNLVRAYEYVWYGEMDIKPIVFQRIQGYFTHLKKLNS
jgi:hypothetical protein